MPTKNEIDTVAETLAEAKSAVSEMSVKLTDATTQLSDATAKLKDAETANAKLTLKIGEETARADAAESELKTLRDEKAARDEKDLADRVEEAFLTYKDKKGLTEASKKTMLIVLKADRAAFDADYPPVAADKRHLLHNLTDKRPADQQTVVEDGEHAKVIDIREAAKLLSAQKGIPLDQAQRIVLLNQPKKGAR